MIRREEPATSCNQSSFARGCCHLWRQPLLSALNDSSAKLISLQRGTAELSQAGNRNECRCSPQAELYSRRKLSGGIKMENNYVWISLNDKVFKKMMMRTITSVCLKTNFNISFKLNDPNLTWRNSDGKTWMIKISEKSHRLEHKFWKIYSNSTCRMYVELQDIILVCQGIKENPNSLSFGGYEFRVRLLVFGVMESRKKTSYITLSKAPSMC